METVDSPILTLPLIKSTKVIDLTAFRKNPLQNNVREFEKITHSKSKFVSKNKTTVPDLNYSYDKNDSFSSLIVGKGEILDGI